MSTNAKLLETARLLGCKGVDKNTKKADLEAAIAETLGISTDSTAFPMTDEQVSKRIESDADLITKHGEGAIAKPTGAVKVVPGTESIPNLSPTGIWQGKRARIRRIKTGNNDIGGAIFRWNGYPLIIPIGVEVDIPWPFLNIIEDAVGMTLTIDQEDDPNNKARVINKQTKEFYQKYPIEMRGVTPGTENLPESPWEYTLDQYAAGFEGFTTRMWRQLCILWEISDADAGVKPGMDPEQEDQARSNAIHFKLNLAKTDDPRVRDQVRNAKRSDIGMASKAA